MCDAQHEAHAHVGRILMGVDWYLNLDYCVSAASMESLTIYMYIYIDIFIGV